MDKFDALLLCSGGMDSTVLAYQLHQSHARVLPLFIDYGQHCVEMEHATLRAVLPPPLASHVVKLDISPVYRDSRSRMIQEADLWRDEVAVDDLYLPYRNLVLLSLAVAYAQAREITAVYAAFINTNHAKEIDCSVGFFAALDEMLAGFGRVEIRLPFRHCSKEEVATIGLKVGAPIAQTFSCQVSSQVPCGACPNCIDRLAALAHVASLTRDQGTM